MTDHWTVARVSSLGVTTDLMTAAEIFGLTRSHVYELARYRPDELPFRVLRVGGRYKVSTSSIVEALSLEVLAGTPQPGNWEQERATYEWLLAEARWQTSIYRDLARIERAFHDRKQD